MSKILNDIRKLEVLMGVFALDMPIDLAYSERI